MIRSVIHDQHYSPNRVFFDQQVLQKADEMRAVLGFGNRPGDRIVDPVVTTKHMSFLFDPRSGRRNALLLSNLHPGGSQGWIERQRRFVHKDEFEIVSKDLFFSSSSSSSVTALASLSYKWLKSCFGRRYRYPFRLSKARNRLSLRSMPVSFSRWAGKRSIVHTEKPYKGFCQNSDYLPLPRGFFEDIYFKKLTWIHFT